MASSTENTTRLPKKYLDYTGVNLLWDTICERFSNKWDVVDFDYIDGNEPTHTDTNVVIPFRNLSAEPAVTDLFKQVTAYQTTYTINQATQETAGVMSAADKIKLDEIIDTIDRIVSDAVTLKAVKVGNVDDSYDELSELINTNKEIAFGLQFNYDKQELAIVDLNYVPDPENAPNTRQPKVLSSVTIDIPIPIPEIESIELDYIATLQYNVIE